MMRWFEEQPGAAWRVSDEIQRRLRFQVHSVMEPAPHPGRFDIILCRNVLLYFSPETRRTAFDRLASACAAEGMLMLGAGETVIGQTSRFVSDPDCRGLYIRAEDAPRASRAAS
jgi:chemotaxis protein methyltransferase CheR